MKNKTVDNSKNGNNNQNNNQNNSNVFLLSEIERLKKDIEILHKFVDVFLIEHNYFMKRLDHLENVKESSIPKQENTNTNINKNNNNSSDNSDKKKKKKKNRKTNHAKPYEKPLLSESESTSAKINRNDINDNNIKENNDDNGNNNDDDNVIIHLTSNDPKDIMSNPLLSIISALTKKMKDNKTKETKEKEKQKQDENESDEEDEFQEYDSDEEFVDLGVEIKSINDLIELGSLFPKLKENYEDNRMQVYEILSDYGIKTSDIDDIVCNKEIRVKNSVKNSEFYELNGKKYSINLEVLYKLTSPLNKLNSLIGLKKIKDSILDMILYYLQNFEKKNKNMLHTIIEGPPGVGKTEVGKIIAEIYASLGVIPSNKFKLVRRTDLIGEYMGHTAHKTQKAIDDAEGGVLFIDEAYSLGSSDKKDTYSKECIDTLNQNLSENRKRFICIIAGYSEELESSFFSHNPGLKRRFPFKHVIDGYEYEEMRDIFMKKIKETKWKLDEDFNGKDILIFFKEKMNNFPNYGGDIENLIVACKFCHSRRVIGKHPKFRRVFTKDDIMNGFNKFSENKKKKEERLSYYN
jgi:hypothetical protein